MGKNRRKRNKTIYAKNNTEAKKQLTLFEANVLSKQIIDETKLSIEGFHGKWLEKYAKNHYGARTLMETERIFKNRLLPEFGPLKLKDVKKYTLLIILMIYRRMEDD